MSPLKTSHEDFENLLRSAAELLCLEESTVEKIKIYYQELSRFSKAYNLTALRTPFKILTEGFLDSLLYLEFIPERAGTLLDVGSGAGFPGLVIKIARQELDTTLLEPSRKKAAFLRHLALKLSLSGIEVVESTVEEYSSTSKKNFDIITTRALFKASEFIRKTNELIHEKSILILSKGPAYEKEVNEIYKKYTDYQVKVEKRKVPLTEIVRYFLLITRKTSITT